MVIHGYIMAVHYLRYLACTIHATRPRVATRPRPAASAMAFWALTQLRADSFPWPGKEGAMVKLHGINMASWFMVIHIPM